MNEIFLSQIAAEICRYQNAEYNAKVIGNETMRRHFRCKWLNLSERFFMGSKDVRHFLAK